MVRPTSPVCSQSAQSFLVQGHLFTYNCAQQHPPRLSTMRTRGVTFSGSGIALKPAQEPSAPSGGFFLPAVWTGAAAGTRQ
jgi:hypothetical protein